MSNVIQGSEGMLFRSSATEKVPVGAKMVLTDGREFRMCENFTTALVIGSLNQSEVMTTNTSDEAVATLAAGVTVLTGVGATGANQAVDSLKYGYVHTSNALTLPLLRIRSNTLITAAAETGTITLFQPTPTAIAAGNTVSYFKNLWRDVIVKPASAATAMIVGVSKIALAANYFGWLQVHGPASVLYDATQEAVAPDDTTAGACAGATAGDLETVGTIGMAMGLVEGDGEQTMVFLTLE
jgi:hypothetical protein